MNLVLIEWLDAWQDQENFSTAHGIVSTHGPMPVETLGWVIQDDSIGISVINERSTQDGHAVFRGRTFIPRNMIKSVTHFNLTKPRKKRASNEPSRPLERAVLAQSDPVG